MKAASWGAVSWMALASVSAVAQSTGPTADAATSSNTAESATSEDANAIADIVVTAQRRSESLSRVPIAVSAFSAETIAQAHITNVNDIAARTPNFTETSGSSGDPHLFIRGIGSSDDSAAGDRSVGVFVDDVYIGRGGAMIADFFDVARVEVLRGPQGTLYGRNVVGGSVNITTAKPGSTFDYGVELGAGNYNLFDARAFVNVPLGETLAGRIAATHTQHSGYSRNVFTGRRVDAANVDAVRGSLRFQPNQDLEVLLRANYSNNDDFGQARDPAPCGPINCLQRFNKPAIGNIAFASAPRDVQSQRDGFFRRDLYGTSGTVNWTTGIGVVSSITAYLHNNWNWLDDIGGLPDVVRAQSTNFVHERAKQFSQELRLSSLPSDSRLSWSLGLYYFRENINRDESTDRCISNTGPTNCVRTYINYSQDVVSKSVAGYAEVEYRLIEPLTIIAGFRYTHDDKSILSEGQNLGPPIPASSSRQAWAPFARSKTWNASTPRIVLRYTFDDAGMAYATISRGYKAGGYQGQADNGISAAIPFEPEHVTNYEVGTKLRLFERHVQLNLAAFVMKYDNLQVRQRIQLDPNNVGSIINVVSNAAAATIKGLEGELTVRPVRNLELFASGSYLDAKYDAFNSGTIDYTGQRLPRSPEYAGTLGAKLTVALRNAGELGLRAEAQYKGKHFFDNDNALGPGIERARTLVDMSATYTPNHGPWEVSVWGKNITNRLYRENIIIIGDSAFSRYGAPRTYGVTLRIHH